MHFQFETNVSPIRIRLTTDGSITHDGVHLVVERVSEEEEEEEEETGTKMILLRKDTELIN